MSTLMSELIEGVEIGPRRIIVYGQRGVGKTTFAAEAPKHVVVSVEDGARNVPCFRFPHKPNNYNELYAQVERVVLEDHDRETLIIDTIDKADELIQDYISAKNGVESLSQLGWARGYHEAASEWRRFLDLMDRAFNERSMNVVLLAHESAVTVSSPDHDSYLSYALKIDKRVAPTLEAWADEIGYAHHEMHTMTKEDGGFGRTRTVAVPVGRRAISFKQCPAWAAKKRLSGLPDTIELVKGSSWATYQSYWPGNANYNG